MNFTSPDLLSSIAAASPEALDALPFGVVKMTADHIVLHYNTYESGLSGMTPAVVIGKNFFTGVAPCTNNFMVAAKYDLHEHLDETLDYVFTYRMAPTKVRLRLLRDSDAECHFLCVEKTD